MVGDSGCVGGLMAGDSGCVGGGICSGRLSSGGLVGVGAAGATVCWGCGGSVGEPGGALNGPASGGVVPILGCITGRGGAGALTPACGGIALCRPAGLGLPGGYGRGGACCAGGGLLMLPPVGLSM